MRGGPYRTAYVRVTGGPLAAVWPGLRAGHRRPAGRRVAQCPSVGVLQRGSTTGRPLYDHIVKNL
jgi:hypothetical protein